MGVKRKRPGRNDASIKKPNVEGGTNLIHENHPVLKHYFQKVTTLREHLLSDLHERKIFAKSIVAITEIQDSPIARILDSVLVGFNPNPEKAALRERRAQDVVSFTQQLPGSTLGSDVEVSRTAQLEVVDFVIWLLFRRNQPPSRPQHLLAQGFERFAAKGVRGLNLSAVPGIPGIICQYSNPHIEIVTSLAWCALLALLGRKGDIVMVDLLLECCLFSSASDNSWALQQFSGIHSALLCFFSSIDSW